MASDVVMNSDGTTYDSDPSAAGTDNGTIWIAWHGYLKSRDSLFLRRIGADGTLGERQTVSAGGNVHGPPHVVVLKEETVWIVWSAARNGRWRILACSFRGGQWSATHQLSQDKSDAIYPAALRIDDEKLIVAWSAYRKGRFRIRSRILENGSWS